MKKTKPGNYQSAPKHDRLNDSPFNNQGNQDNQDNQNKQDNQENRENAVNRDIRTITDYETYFTKTVKEFDDFLEIPVHVNVIVGKKMVRISELLALAPGSVLDLKRPAGDSLLIFLEDTLFGKGEVTVKEDTFFVRITGINDPRNV